MDMTCMTSEREGTVAMKGKVREIGVGNKAKVDVCLGCPILSFKNSSLICIHLCSN